MLKPLDFESIKIGNRKKQMASGNRFVSVDKFHLDSKWLIDPNQVFVGPKIGEGAHAKVYEGNYSSSKKLRYSFPSIDSSDEENTSTVMTDPASVAPSPAVAHASSMSSPQASQGAILLEHSEFDDTTNNEDKLTSVNQHSHAIASHNANNTFHSQ